MINGVRLKVCGLTSLVDAEFADACGADYLGFILYPKSPRYLSLTAYEAMAPRLPPRKKVAVVVEPEMDEIERLKGAGFDHVQIHFPNETPFFQVALWSDVVGLEKLWIAPRVEPGKEMDPAFFPLTGGVLVDGYKPNAFGGTGQTADWAEFVHLKDKYTRVQWILAGGLNAENIGPALAATSAQTVDVNSGVEAAPGVKDHAKLKAFVAALHRATVRDNPAYEV